MPADHFNPTSMGGWIAAASVLLVWMVRAFSVVRRMAAFEATVLVRLSGIEARQERMSERFFQEVREVRRDMALHRDAERADK